MSRIGSLERAKESQSHLLTLCVLCTDEPGNELGYVVAIQDDDVRIPILA